MREAERIMGGVRGCGARIVAAVVTVVLALAGTACEPAPPPIVFVATAGYVGADANPGDGVCDAGNGYCGITTAISEANALHAATGAKVRIELAWSPYYAHTLITTGLPGTDTDPTVVVTGDVQIVAADDRFITIDTTRVHVAAGARLEIDVVLINHRGCETMRCPPRGDTKFLVDGTLILRDGRLHMGGVHIIKVNAGGVAYLRSMSVTGELYTGPNGEDGSQAIWNEGSLILDHSSVAVGGSVGAVHTAGDGRTVMAGSTIYLPYRDALDPIRFPPVPAGGLLACGGTPPESLGGNQAGPSCQLSGPGDVTTAAG